MRNRSGNKHAESGRCVLIGDIRGSSHLERWPQIFKALGKVLKDISRGFAEDILVPFSPTVGDEFQGVLQSPAAAYDICLHLKAGLPAPFYLGIGVGEVERPAKGPSGMRGTAFYRARAALDRCKAQKRGIVVGSADSLLLNDEVLNAMLELIFGLESKRTRRQLEILQFYRVQHERTYEDVGAFFGISKQSVHGALKASSALILVRADDIVRRLLRETPGSAAASS